MKIDTGSNLIITDPNDMKRIRIRCRCTHSWIEQVPGEVIRAKLKVVCYCEACGQAYIYCDGKVMRSDGKRLEQNTSPAPEPVVEPADFKLRPGAFHVPPPKSGMAN